METFRKIMFTGVLVVISQGSKIQAIVALCLSLFFVRLYGFYRPYIDDIVDTVAELAQWQLFVVIFLILLLRDDEFTEGLPFYIIDVILVINFFTSIMLEILYAIWYYCYKRMFGIKGGDINMMFGNIDEGVKFSIKDEIKNQNDLNAGLADEMLEEQQGKTSDLISVKESCHVTVFTKQTSPRVHPL